MHCQLEHEDLCRWIMVLTQVEQNRVEILAPGTVEKMKPLAKRIGAYRRRAPPQFK